MIYRFAKCVSVAALGASCLFADFSYEQTSKITGGMMAGVMKFAGAFSKSMREPIRTTVSVKGDRMVTLTANQASVIDLSKETFTEINFEKKQYSVMTFADMARMMQEATEKSKSKDQGEMKITASVNETGQTRKVNNLDTKEVIVKLLMEPKEKKEGETAGLEVVMDMWLAPSVAGYEEVRQFHMKMAQKLTWAPGGGMLSMGRSDMAKAIAEVYKEGSKLDGIPVLQFIKMGASGVPVQAGAAQSGDGQQQAPPPQQERNVQPERPSVGGALGGALGGRLGGLGGFGRRKKQPKEEQQPAPQEQPAQQAQAAPAGQGQAGGPGSLMELTTELSGFSAGAVDGSKFEVPAGFKQVQPDKRIR